MIAPDDINELIRRITNLVRVGVVHATAYSEGRIRVALNGEPDALTPWIPWVTRRAGNDVDYWAPELGEQVIVLSPGGEFAQAFAMCATYQAAVPSPHTDPDRHTTVYQDGTTIDYNRTTHVLDVDVQGDLVINIKNGATVVVGGDVDVTAGGNVNVTSDGAANVVAGGGVTLDGAAVGAALGIVQGDCMCAFTGAPHPQISATVRGSK